VAIVTHSGERCPARVELGDTQVEWLGSRPYAGHQVRRHHDCVLEVGHDGPHGSLGQQGDEIEWWIRWTLNASEIVKTEVCPAIRNYPDEHGEDVVCLLFVGHPGRHSFELDP
jgi:hypothetical protein